ncbi:M4 family metallopeptidase [Streptomyces lunaelactis]|uniref:M4 family metallopeptidase n=1 Tax=Streptomyces lunaelactis TaxID=1535768 RepID=UPI00158574F3|nr:M4 family metallopeptidase [Streptomyces lunaelactis]NUK11749.1 M4 family metallopeptidase [Streptomyces lunaelactis]NUL12816.1 M4 family metallopeptidase [Streptomyces lunaelactis]NUL25937.1 M4 family metallopeptidase [Streptomyces lunaelactis]
MTAPGIASACRLERFRYHRADAERDPKAQEQVDKVLNSISAVDNWISAEHAARCYLEKFVDEIASENLKRAIHKGPKWDHAIVLLDPSRMGKTTLVRFGQNFHHIRVFGAEALVEVDESNRLIALRWNLGAVDKKADELLPDISIDDAAFSVLSSADRKIDAGSVISREPELKLLQDEQAWHLVWHFFDVPANQQTDSPESVHDSTLDDFPMTDFLVDAHTGHVLISYTKALSAAPVERMSVSLTGYCEQEILRTISGVHSYGGYQFDDPFKKVRTHDLGFQVPGRLSSPPLTVQTSNIGSSHKGAVSAHFNATRVRDFYRLHFPHHEIAGNGPIVESVLAINCANGSAGKEWRHAQWCNGIVWFGQFYVGPNKLMSTAKFLDVTAHEMTHGVISATSGLYPEGESGAINESFADIFGIVVKNWYERPDPSDVATWEWVFGDGYAKNGGPLRDIADPRRLQHPEHTDDYVKTRGAVHLNSCIHSKALYHLLTMGYEETTPVLRVDDWIRVLYGGMVRLPAGAQFGDVPGVLRNSVYSDLSPRPAVQERINSLISVAFQHVGIVED